MVETWSPIDIVMHYYGNETADGGQIPFNFQMISNLGGDSDAHHYSEMINKWFQYMPPGRTPNWVVRKSFKTLSKGAVKYHPFFFSADR